MVYIFAVHMGPNGSSHEHIASVKWKNPDNGKTGESTREVMVDWIANKGGAAYVCGGNCHMARVGVVQGNPPYVRTYADGDWSDNLLALPNY
jgi:hypothetical protein